MDTYIITAKTVEEAISAAKKQYEDENHEVSYEILEMPKKGIFGLGARDARIKITVSKSEKVELGSLVAEMRSMKNLTSRGGEEEKPKPVKPQNGAKPAPSQKNPQPKAEMKTEPKAEPKQPKPQNGEKSAPAQKNPQPKAEMKTEPKAEPKPVKPQNGEKSAPAQKNPQPKAEMKTEPKAEPKPVKPQNGEKSAPSQKNPQPKAEPKAETKMEQKPVKPQNGEKSAPAQQNPQPKAEAKAEPKAEPKQPKPEGTHEAAETSRLDAAIASATTVTTRFGDAGAEYTSSLHNSGRPNRRTQQKRASSSSDQAKGAAVTVSQPMGLSDFVADPAAQDFGRGNAQGSRTGGRMNNDVRKKKKPAPKAGASSVAKYDFAESDDDYEKLDRLVRESDDELEAAEAANLVPRAAAAMDTAVDAAMDSDAAADADEAEEFAPVREIRRREAITQAEMDYALDFANTLLADMKLNARAVPAECPEGEEFDVTEEADVYPKIDIVGDDTGILIGHHGETLDSIQYLVNLSALRKTRSKDGDYVKIVVDIENYREKREDTLRTLARRMAARAVKYKRNVFLEPMNAYERRIIHSELQSFENVSTHSVGADRDRKIIITYEGPDRQPDNRSSGNRRKRGDRASAEESASGAGSEGQAEQAVQAEPKENGGRNRRRPRKAQKMPIEKLNELLPGGDDSAETAVETAADAAVEQIETAVEKIEQIEKIETAEDAE